MLSNNYFFLRNIYINIKSFYFSYYNYLFQPNLINIIFSIFIYNILHQLFKKMIFVDLEEDIFSLN